MDTFLNENKVLIGLAGVERTSFLLPPNSPPVKIDTDGELSSHTMKFIAANLGRGNTLEPLDAALILIRSDVNLKPSNSQDRGIEWEDHREAWQEVLESSGFRRLSPQEQDEVRTGLGPVVSEFGDAYVLLARR